MRETRVSRKWTSPRTFEAIPSRPRQKRKKPKFEYADLATYAVVDAGRAGDARSVCKFTASAACRLAVCSYVCARDRRGMSTPLFCFKLFGFRRLRAVFETRGGGGGHGRKHMMRRAHALFRPDENLAHRQSAAPLSLAYRMAGTKIFAINAKLSLFFILMA